MNIQLADLNKHWDGASELFQANWAETGFDFEFDPRVEVYQAMQDTGRWFAMVALDGDDVVGYSSAVVAGHPFNPSVICCASDSLFVRPDLRPTSLGARLIRATEAEAKRRGAVRMLWHTRAGTALSSTMLRRGYVSVDTVVMRSI
jgi:GNAT superfamily N-acetyltransferase